ncbi:MAG TPA: TlpA disulfide reductase family protein [Acidimicrobiia bacterium]|nr:TlpA disulfide reductase family protein [Acidimicrobiia bacterium]
MPVWQELATEFGDALVILTVALDEDVDAVRQWAVEEPTTPLTYPVLVDRDHLVAERYGIVNVPTTVWIDEEGFVVRPPSIAPADDRFKDFTQLDSSVHHDALRTWVHDGVAPLSNDELRARLTPPSPELQVARVERRLAMHLLRADARDAAEQALARAMALAPEDWTIHRGSMPVRGEDPFGQAFFDFYQQWEAAGRPGYDA